MTTKGTPLHRHNGTSKSEFSERSDIRRMHLRDTDREDCALYRSCLDALARRRDSNNKCLGCPDCARFVPCARKDR